MIPPVLDVSCGSRAFWFTKLDGRAIYVDNRIAVLERVHYDRPRNPVVINPNIKGDFTCLPFQDETFALVVFDPPHIIGNSTGNITKYYGVLKKDKWEEKISKGFSECFRVLKPEGSLIFKWAETNVSIKKIVELSKHLPLFGNKQPKAAGTHWIVFIK